MGMFDEIRSEMPLPGGLFDSTEIFQTKDTPNQFLDMFKIDADGYLWVDNYDIVDDSVVSKWKRDNPDLPVPDTFGTLDYIVGAMSRVNHRTVRHMHTGVIQFYTYKDNKYVLYSAKFVDGKTNKINLIRLEDKNFSPTKIEKWPVDDVGEVCTKSFLAKVADLTAAGWYVTLYCNPDNQYTIEVTNAADEYYETELSACTSCDAALDSVIQQMQ